MLHAIVVISIAALAAACATGPSENDGIIQGAPPVQVRLTGDPIIYPDAYPDSTIFLITVAAEDSSMHRNWRYSMLRVESSRGYSADVPVVPFGCLTVREGSFEFPFYFEWWKCDRAGAVTSVVLTDAAVSNMEALVNGRMVERYVLRSQPAATYEFRVPVGLETTNEAVRRLRRAPDVVRSDPLHSSPLCIIADPVPPPPCPPWMLTAYLPYSFGDSPGGDSIPVAHGGWFRATYVEPSGNERSTTFIMP